MNKEWVAILDFGSQYTHLVARRVRECGVYSEIISYDTNACKLSSNIPTCIILSGGPASVTEKGSPVCDKDIFNIGDPVEVASIYSRENADELVFIPLTVGGGIRSIEDIRLLLKSGADKVSLNTAAVENKNLIKEASEKFCLPAWMPTEQRTGMI